MRNWFRARTILSGLLEFMAGLKVTQREYTGRGCEVTHFLFTNGHFSMQNTHVSIDTLLVTVRPPANGHKT